MFKVHLICTLRSFYSWIFVPIWDSKYYAKLRLQMNPFEYIPLTFYIENPDADSVNELLQKFDELEN